MEREKNSTDVLSKGCCGRMGMWWHVSPMTRTRSHKERGAQEASASWPPRLGDGAGIRWGRWAQWPGSTPPAWKFYHKLFPSRSHMLRTSIAFWVTRKNRLLLTISGKGMPASQECVRWPGACFSINHQQYTWPCKASLASAHFPGLILLGEGLKTRPLWLWARSFIDHTCREQSAAKEEKP